MTDNTSQPGSRRQLHAALFVSLAFNLFFAGLILGGPMIFGAPDGDRVRGGGPGASLLPSPRMFIEILGPEDGRKVLQQMREDVPDLRDKFKAVRANHSAVVAAMRADPYDPQELAKAFETVRAAHNDLTSSIQRPLVTILADLTPQQRQQFADAFVRMAKHNRRPGGPRDGDADEDRPPRD